MTLLAPFGPGIWLAEGPVVPFHSFPFPTRMVVIRLADGQLFIWSPIALTPELRVEVDALGPVAHLVSPNKIHHLYMGDWEKTYPAARLYASPGLPQRRRDLAFDAVLGDAPEPAWTAEIDQVAMLGSFVMTEIVFFHRASSTVIFADLIENFPRGWFKGWQEWVGRLDGFVQPQMGAPREWQLSFWNRKAARRALERILAWAPRQVIIAHGDMARSGGTAFVARGFSWLRH